MRHRMTPNIYTIARAICAQLFCLPIPKVSGSNPLGRTNPLKFQRFIFFRPPTRRPETAKLPRVWRVPTGCPRRLKVISGKHMI